LFCRASLNTSCVALLLFINFFIFFYYVYLSYFFFFSSRRRHTRFSRDWSSDVCSSDLALMGEQPNPWDRLRPQDATSRHRGAKPPRRCGLLGEISLLSPG